MLHVAFACSGDAEPRLVDHYALLPFMPEKTQTLREPFRLRVVHQTQDRKEISLNVIPDRLFSLGIDQRRWNFSLELDRGTMSNGIKSTRLGKSSYRRKLIGYFQAWKQGRHTEQWGFRSFRVLTITTSDKRIEHMLAVQREVTNDSASGLFLYATPQRIATHGALGTVWTTSDGNAVSLLDRT